MASKRCIKELTAVEQRLGKKQKKDAVAEKLNQQLSLITAALQQAPMTPELQETLAVVLPLSLGEFSDQRHRFQQQVVEGIAGLLGQVEAALHEELSNKRKERDGLVGEKAQLEKNAVEALDQLNAKVAEVHRLKVALADIVTAFRSARSSLTEAEEAKVIDGQKAREATEKKGDFSVALENLRAMKVMGPEDAEWSLRNVALMALLRKYKFEESILIALPTALAKAPDARGQFDLLAITQLESEIEKLIAEQEAILAASAPSQAKHEQAIQEAQERLTAARSEQRDAAKAFDMASEEQTHCEAISNAAQMALKESAQKFKQLEKAVYNAEVEVEIYEQGPRDNFSELRDRVTPPTVVEVEAPEEVVAAAAMEAVTPVHEGMPVAAC